jgi:hypothetical protein
MFFGQRGNQIVESCLVEYIPCALSVQVSLSLCLSATSENRWLLSGRLEGTLLWDQAAIYSNDKSSSVCYATVQVESIDPENVSLPATSSPLTLVTGGISVSADVLACLLSFMTERVD